MFHRLTECNLECYDQMCAVDALNFFQWTQKVRCSQYLIACVCGRLADIQEPRIVAVAPWNWLGCPTCQKYLDEVSGASGMALFVRDRVLYPPDWHCGAQRDNHSLAADWQDASTLLIGCLFASTTSNIRPDPTTRAYKSRTMHNAQLFSYPYDKRQPYVLHPALHPFLPSRLLPTACLPMLLCQ
jgi:hypothetical protein